MAAAGRGTFVLDGIQRMRERPIQDLVDGLVQLGVDAKCTLGTGCPPVEVKAAGLPSGKVGLVFKHQLNRAFVPKNIRNKLQSFDASCFLYTWCRSLNNPA